MGILSNHKKKDWRIGIEEKLSQANKLLQSSMQEIEANKFSKSISKETVSHMSEPQTKRYSSSNANAKRAAIHRTAISEAGEREGEETALQSNRKIGNDTFGLPKRFRYPFPITKDTVQSENLDLEKSSFELKIKTLSSYRNQSPETAASPFKISKAKNNSESELLLPKPLPFVKTNLNKKKTRTHHKIQIKQSHQVMPNYLGISPTQTSASILKKIFFLQHKEEPSETLKDYGDLKLALKKNDTGGMKTVNESSPKDGILIGPSPYLRLSYSPRPITSLELPSPKVTSMNEIGMQLTKHWESKYAPSLVKHNTLSVLHLDAELDIRSESIHSKSVHPFQLDTSLTQSPVTPIPLSKLKPIHSSQGQRSWSKSKRLLKITETSTAKSKRNNIASMSGKGGSFTSFIKI